MTDKDGMQIKSSTLGTNFGYNSSSLVTYGINSLPNPQSTDIWTQANEMKNRYSAQLQMVNPMNSNEVLVNFMNESLSSLSAIMSSVDSKSTNTSTSSLNNLSFEVRSENQVEESEVKKERAPYKKSGQTMSDEYIKNVIEDGSYNIKAIIFDPIYSLESKAAFLAAHREEQIKNGTSNKLLGHENTLIAHLNQKLDEGTCTAEEAIEVIKILNATAFKQNDKALAIEDYYSGRPNAFAKNLYLRAQEEGILFEALNLFPSKKYLNLGSDNEQVYNELFTKLDSTANAQKSAGNKKYDVSQQRATYLKNRFDTISKGLENAENGKAILETTLMPEIANSNAYTPAERLYLLQLLQDKMGGVEKFTASYRQLSKTDQDKYLPMIMTLYAKLSD